MLLADVLRQSGVNITEFATLVRVHRVTVHSWLKGGPIRQQIQQATVDKMVGLLVKGVEAGKLPIAGGIPREKRLQHIRAVLHELIKNG